MHHDFFKVAFIGGATDFHAMDWVKSCLKSNPNKKVYLLTDLLDSQGFSSIKHPNLLIINLVILDKYLFNKQSYFAHKWRNLLKLILLPIQALILHKFHVKHPDMIFHAHSMYYMVLARMAGVRYIGTPVGSDILVKPYQSFLFFLFAKYGIDRSHYITVDSKSMKDIIISKFKFMGNIDIIQNGIDYESIKNNNTISLNDTNTAGNYIHSIRGIAPIYQQELLINSRNTTIPDIPIYFSYPFVEVDYWAKLKGLTIVSDKDFAKVDKLKLYELMRKSTLVVSIPFSDSSPRSVYEAIFCGAIVAINSAKYFDELPKCMQNRLIKVDLNDPNWLKLAFSKALKLKSEKFVPSDETILMFDQYNSYKSMEKIYDAF